MRPPSFIYERGTRKVLEHSLCEMPRLRVAAESPVAVEWGEEATTAALAPLLGLKSKLGLIRPVLSVPALRIAVREPRRDDVILVHDVTPKRRGRPFGSGISRPASRAVSSQRAIASCALATASLGVAPWAMQPVSSGTSTTKVSSSALQNTISSYRCCCVIAPRSTPSPGGCCAKGQRRVRRAAAEAYLFHASLAAVERDEVHNVARAEAQERA